MPEQLTQNAIVTELRAFVADWFRNGNDHGLADETPLVTSGIVDSAGVVEVVEFLEHQYGIKIQDADITLANCNTLRGWADLVLRRRG